MRAELIAYEQVDDAADQCVVTVKFTPGWWSRLRGGKRAVRMFSGSAKEWYAYPAGGRADDATCELLHGLWWERHWSAGRRDRRWSERLRPFR